MLFVISKTIGHDYVADYIAKYVINDSSSNSVSPS